MFSYFTQLLSRFESKTIRLIVLAALGVLVAAVVLGSFIRWLRRRKQNSPTAWTGLLTDSAGGVLKALIGLAVVVGLCLHLKFEGKEFARLRGGVSDRNRAAVETIWGRPHVQRELSVHLQYPTTHYYDKDGLEIDMDRLAATTTQPISFRKEVRQNVVPGNPVLSADHRIELTPNYRRKGTGTYPGFETRATFRYKFRNFSDRKVEARFHFPMPARQGLVDEIDVRIDGKPVAQKLVMDGEAIRWGMDLAAGEQHELSIAYHSRGLDHLRLEPGAGREMEQYRIELLCREMRKDDLNYPVGCMTPTDIAPAADGSGVLLTWNLRSAVSRLGMGVILPRPRQEGYRASQVLDAAPMGLVLLLTMVLVTHLLGGKSPHWLVMFLLAVAYDLHHLLTASLSDYAPGLYGGLAISTAATTILVALLSLKWDARFPAVATVVFFAVFAAGWPMLKLSEDEILWTTVLYVVLLTYVVVLAVRTRRRLTAEEVSQQVP